MSDYPPPSTPLSASDPGKRKYKLIRFGLHSHDLTSYTSARRTVITVAFIHGPFEIILRYFGMDCIVMLDVTNECCLQNNITVRAPNIFIGRNISATNQSKYYII